MRYKRKLAAFLAALLPAVLLSGCNVEIQSANEITKLINGATVLKCELVTETRYEETRDKYAVYIFRDENGVEFSVTEGIEYGSNTRFTAISSDYPMVLMAPWTEEVISIFEKNGINAVHKPAVYIPGDTVNSYTSDEFIAYVSSFEQFPALADAMTEAFDIVPAFPFYERNGEWNFSPPKISAEYIIDEKSVYMSSMKFPIVGENKPDAVSLLYRLENELAENYKLDEFPSDIPLEALMREPPLYFKTVILGETDISGEISVVLTDGVYRTGINLFSGGNYFNWCRIEIPVNALGGKYEYIDDSSTEWEISGDKWRAEKIKTERINKLGNNEWDSFIYKNGDLIISVTDCYEYKFTLEEAEALLGVKAEYVNSEDVLRLTRD